MILLHPDRVKELKKMGFFYVTVVNRNISARPIGSVEAAFRTRNDSQRFTSALNAKYGPHSYATEAL